MLIGAYGMFWNVGLAGMTSYYTPKWSMLGSHGVNRPKFRVVDFRKARGVYVLYDDHGAYYAGLARGAGGIHQRLRDHMVDKHADHWQRFSWFAFDGVGDAKDPNGLNVVSRRVKPVPAADEMVIRELEALLIQVLGTRGQSRMKFAGADQWTQVAEWGAELAFSKVRPA